MKIEIIYATKHNTVSRCAEEIKKQCKELADCHLTSEVERKVAEEADILVLGMPFYMGSIPKKMKNFMQKNEEILKEKPVYIFTCGLSSGADLEVEVNRNFSKELQDNAKGIYHFGGEIRFSNLGFLEKWMMEKILKSKEDVCKLEEQNIDKLVQKIKSDMQLVEKV